MCVQLCESIYTASSILWTPRNRNDKMKRARKMKKRILAIPTATVAIPPKPKMAAMIAKTKNVIDQDSMFVFYR